MTETNDLADTIVGSEIIPGTTISENGASGSAVDDSVVILAPDDNPEMEAITNKIAAALNEERTIQIRQIVSVLGTERTMEFMEQALAIEADGGMQTKDERRRRTPGGVFFKHVRTNIPYEEYRQIFSYSATRAMGLRPARKAADERAISEEEAQTFVEKVLSLPIGKVRTVKLTLTGRPKQVVKAKSCMVLAMQGGQPTSGFPKGLPRLPFGDQKFVVFVALKQWRKVSTSLSTDLNQELVIEGFPLFDAKKQMTVVMARNVTSRDIPKK